jgi:hypothetical protein
MVRVAEQEFPEAEDGILAELRKELNDLEEGLRDVDQ